MASAVWRRVRLALGAALTATVVACGGGGGDSTPPPVTGGTVTGLAVSAATGLPMTGVAVASGSASAVTAADGHYTLNNVTPGAAVLSFTASGHAKAFANATVVLGETSSASARLTPLGVSQAISAAAGATVTVPGTPAQVSLPAAGIADRNGAAYSGTVAVEVTPINPALDPGNMPGDLTTRASGGAVVPIESFGALTVTLQDASGNRLNLASGSTATVRIPLATRSPSPPATIPLFYFDEATGLWVEEGTATLQGTAPDQYYEGTVSHFTTWNADQVANTVSVTGCVQDANGTRVAGAAVRADGVDYSGAATARTDAAGNFSVSIRRGSTASVAAEESSRYSNSVTVGPSQATIVLSNCLALGNGAPVFVLQPVSQGVTEGGYVVLQSIARGQAPLRYQWQRNGTAIAGATAASLLIEPVSNADNAAVYRVVATNGVGSTTSDGATLTVASLPPAIATQPAPQSVVAGAAATFSVQMRSQGAPLSYQWLRGGQVINGATGSSYTLNPAQLTDNGASFSVRVSNAVGQVTSDAATLSVTAAPVAPSISQQPASISVYVGQSAQFSVVAGGSAPLSYQWRRNGQPIGGATSDSYTLNPTALADTGAVFSVVVTNAAGNRTSADATLTVTEAPVGSGYFLVGNSGARATGSIVFANGSQTVNSPALVAINSINPAAGVATVEVAGNYSPVYSPVMETTVQGTQLSNTRQRYTFYFKNSRLHRLDHVSPDGPPTGQVVSTLTSTEVCGEGGQAYVSGSLGSLNDLADVTRSWVLLRSPGADNQCGTSDDVFRAVRAGMTSTDAPLSFTGEPLMEIYGSNGALAGVIVVDGLVVRKLDANLANPVTVHTLASSNWGGQDFGFGSSWPGIWLFFDGDKLYGYKLDGSGGAPSVLATLTAAEQATSRRELIASGGVAYAAISDGTGSRILRVAENLSVSTVAATGPGDFYYLYATPTRLIFHGMAGMSSVPKTGGALTTLASLTPSDQISTVKVAGETIYYAQYSYGGNNGLTQSVGVVQSDGSNAQTWANSSILWGLFGQSVDISNSAAVDEVYALVIAQGLTAEGQYAGATLRAVLGTTRATLLTYGTLPATPAPLTVIPSGLSPWHYGQSGLFTLMTFSGQGESTDLMYYDSDTAGLVRLTNSMASPSRAGLRPLGARTLPGWLSSRVGVLHAQPLARSSVVLPR